MTPDLPIIPNFFVKAKGSDGSHAVTMRRVYVTVRTGSEPYRVLSSTGMGKQSMITKLIPFPHCTSLEPTSSSRNWRIADSASLVDEK